MQHTHKLAFGGPNDKQVAYLIGGEDERQVFQIASRCVHNYCVEKGIDSRYTRMWNMDGSTVFDFGSHSQFFFLIPKVNLEVVLAKEESDECN